MMAKKRPAKALNSSNSGAFVRLAEVGIASNGKASFSMGGFKRAYLPTDNHASALVRQVMWILENVGGWSSEAAKIADMERARATWDKMIQDEKDGDA